MAKRRVLIVEDDEVLRQMYREVFHDYRFEVSEAGDGETAVDQALITQPQVIVLDLMLPRQGGLGVMRILRSLPETKKIPIFIMTAMVDPKYQEIAGERVAGYFHKSTTPPIEMVRQIQIFLDRYSDD